MAFFPLSAVNKNKLHKIVNISALLCESQVARKGREILSDVLHPLYGE